MAVSLDLLMNAVVSGLLLGGFYAAVSVGVAIAFGLLDIVNIAHPAFILLGSYVAFIGNTRVRHRSDPGRRSSAAGLLPARHGGLPGLLRGFERRDDQSLRGLSFFFGLLFITEVALVLIFGVDYRLGAGALYRPSINLGLYRPAVAPAGAVPGLAWSWWSACSSSCRAPSSAAPSRRWRRTRGRCG